jgi:hypothetical protein
MSTSNDSIALGVNVFTVPVFANPIALRSSAILLVSGPTRLRLPDVHGAKQVRRRTIR